MLAFKLAVAFCSGEWLLGLCGVAVALLVLALPLIKGVRGSRAAEPTESPVVGE